MRSILLLIVLCIGCAPPAGTSDFTALVVGVNDGDTITVVKNLEEVRIRLCGIDCPERGQPFGNKARDFTSDACFGSYVTVSVRDEDRYDRLVADVQLQDGSSLNQELVRAGLAWHYKQYSKNTQLASLEQDARNAHRGLWSDARAVAPWDWRRNGKSEKAKVVAETSTAALTHWLSGPSGIRHNSSCKHFGRSKGGRACSAAEGVACKLCGG